MIKPTFTNKLALETSPYLLQHAHNPVDWYPWGEEALRKAKKENKPIFLSIGYSACHWCHVMEKESFEDETTAKLLNEYFVSIKVDREERPDLDNIYMNAIQMMTHRGGWPMTVFLTPELKPFYGGTYFPPEDKMGMPSFKKIILGIANTWKNRESEVKKSAEELLTALQEITKPQPSKANSPSVVALTEAAFHKTKHSFDPTYGGLGKAPKFFHTTDFKIALRHWKNNPSEDSLAIIHTTLELWARGGIYDQLGGGFHRYSTDDQWLVPHFEKMLYDNALLTELYLEAYQATHHLTYAKIAREIIDYVIRDLKTPEGIFYSTEDADSEGVEGKYYVWNKDEIDQCLGAEIANVFNRVFSVSKQGNWEGHNILHRTESLTEVAGELNLSEAELEESLALAKRKLFALRKKRVKPGIDTKSLTSWNAMMIHSLGIAHQVLNEPSYFETAEQALNFILQNLWDGQHLKHSFAKGFSKEEGFLEDYANLLNAVLTIYESSFKKEYLTMAQNLAHQMIQKFWDANSHTFFFAENKKPDLIVRPTDSYDGAVPSSAGMAITALTRLGKLTYENRWLHIAEQALSNYEPQMRTLPQASGQMLVALQLLEHQSQEWVLIPGQEDNLEEWLTEIRSHYVPNKVIAVKREPNDPNLIFRGKTSINQKTTLYICENKTCLAPITAIEELKRICHNAP